MITYNNIEQAQIVQTQNSCEFPIGSIDPYWLKHPIMISAFVPILKTGVLFQIEFHTTKKIKSNG